MTDAVRGSWRGWTIWIAGTLAFIAAVFSRTSFGVAGVQAAEHFGAQVGAMSAFVIVQMLVYATMQIPAGVLLDSHGSRKTIAAGLAIISVGQLGLAIATSFPLGLAARILIGGGDALIFSSAIRLIVTWFPPRQVAVLTQLTAVMGQVGQWLSAVPLVWILNNHGWMPAFLTVAGACLLGCLIDVLVVRDAPRGVDVTSHGSGGAFAGVREVIAMPAAQLGFFVHMISASAPLMFTFMWGFPYLTQAQGLSDAQAGNVLTIMVIGGIIIGPLMGLATRRSQHRRVFLVLGVAGATAVIWTLMLVWPGSAPTWLLVTLAIALAACPPASNIAFDINRSYVPGNRLGTATGVVIVGGFLAALFTVAAIGAILSVLGGGDPSPDDFRIAMSTQLIVWVVAGVMVVRKRRQVLRENPPGSISWE